MSSPAICIVLSCCSANLGLHISSADVSVLIDAPGASAGADVLINGGAGAGAGVLTNEAVGAGGY